MTIVERSQRCDNCCPRRARWRVKTNRGGPDTLLCTRCRKTWIRVHLLELRRLNDAVGIERCGSRLAARTIVITPIVEPKP